MVTLLVIDNYDSFTYNLAQMFMRYDMEIRVFRNDQITVERAQKLRPAYLLIGPGPKDPAHAGISIPLLKAFLDKIPILGVCLGMQCINEVMGGQTVQAPLPVHGKKSRVFHERKGVFKNLPSPFTAARYHSLMVEAALCPLEKTAWTEDHIVMGIVHDRFPVFGVQFHPESFMTGNGRAIVENFLSYGPMAPAFSSAA